MLLEMSARNDIEGTMMSHAVHLSHPFILN